MHTSRPLPLVVDCFAGCGGMSLGLLRAGFDVAAGLDAWDKAVTTYAENFDHPVFHCDLGDVDTAAATIRTVADPHRELMVVGGPPCQDFSVAGRRTEGARAALTIRFAELVATLDPAIVVMENVSQSRNSPTYHRAWDHLTAHGYHLAGVVLDASRCGVPSRRRRLFTIGTKSASHTAAIMAWLDTHLSPSPMTVREYFGDSLGIDAYWAMPRNYHRRGVFSIDEPAPTMRGNNRPVSPGYPGHPRDAADHRSVRALTTMERAQIQTFPADFQFPVAKTHAEQMIGNAVPVHLAQYVGTAIASTWHTGDYE